MEQLIEYWFDESSPEKAAGIEQHLIACGGCSGRLQQLAALSAGTRQVVTSGDFGAVLSGTFVARLKETGLRVREYRVPPGGSVACTIAPQDDVVVSRLSASLGGVERLDLLLQGPEVRGAARLKDVPFNPQAGEVIFAPGAAYLRTLDTVTQRLQLIAVSATGERLVGEYTFNHHRYTG
jgi:hypothetical protein